RGFMVPYINHYAHSVNLKNTIEQIRIDLSDFHNFPKLNFKRDALFIMQTAFSPKGENPNAVALQAATIILNELLTEKERELEKIVTHISDKKKFPTMQSIITFLTNEQSRLSLEPTPDLIRLAAIESALWQANDRKYADATNLKTTIALIKKDLENIDIKHNKKFYLYELLKKYGPTENTPNNLVCTAAQYILDELIKQDLFYKPWE